MSKLYGGLSELYGQTFGHLAITVEGRSACVAVVPRTLSIQLSNDDVSFQFAVDESSMGAATKLIRAEPAKNEERSS
jgi:hypothetical protein